MTNKNEAGDASFCLINVSHLADSNRRPHPYHGHALPSWAKMASLAYQISYYPATDLASTPHPA